MNTKKTTPDEINDFLALVDNELSFYTDCLRAAGMTTAIADLKKVFERAIKLEHEKTIEHIIQNKEKVLTKCKSVSVPVHLANSVDILFGIIENSRKSDSCISHISGAVSAIIVSYFFNPIDLIPDFNDEYGYHDDTAFMLIGVRIIAAEFITYCNSNNLPFGLIFSQPVLNS